MEINHFKKRGLSAMLATSLSVTGLGIPCINAQDLESIIKQKEISQEQTKIKTIRIIKRYNLAYPTIRFAHSTASCGVLRRGKFKNS